MTFVQTFPLVHADKHVCNEFPECNGLALCAGGEESMRNRSGWKHWLFTGLALLSGASYVHGQTGSPNFAGAAYGGAPGMPGGMNGLGNHGPMSIAMPGPPPMEVAYASGPGPMGSAVQPAGAFGGGCACCDGACDTGAYCDSMGGLGLGDCGPGMGDGACAVCGTYPCLLGSAPIRNIFRGGGLGSRRMNSDGCYACGWGNNAVLPGRLCGLLGRLAPYAEGGQSQRWFDFHVGTLALTRTDDILSSVVTTQGVAGNPVLRTGDVAIDDLRFGLTATAALQVGPGGNLELTYFGLNKWHSTATALSNAADLYSVVSNFGTNPLGGYDDTDQSINQSLTYDSAIHNGELNFRRRWVAPARWIQGSWLAGVRYFDLDEELLYQTVGLNNNGPQIGQPRFSNLNTATRNQLTGFQLGSDTWLSVVPGFMLGIEGKYGVYGNHATAETNLISNSIPNGRESISEGETAYLGELMLGAVYRVTYSWTFRASYNNLRVDNVALAPRNFNPRGIGSAGGNNFFDTRNPFLDVNGTAKFSGFSLGAEYLW